MSINLFKIVRNCYLFLLQLRVKKPPPNGVLEGGLDEVADFRPFRFTSILVAGDGLSTSWLW